MPTHDNPDALPMVVQLEDALRAVLEPVLEQYNEQVSYLEVLAALQNIQSEVLISGLAEECECEDEGEEETQR